jgi:hypothetical protein
MSNYFLATCEKPDGERFNHVMYGTSEDEARRIFGPTIEGTILTVEAREYPAWALVEPVLSAPFKRDGQTVYSLRDHLLAGGVLECDYRGSTFRAVPTIFEADEIIGEGDNAIVHIGSVEIVSEGSEPFVFKLDALDEAHAIDHLNSQLIGRQADRSPASPAPRI